MENPESMDFIVNGLFYMLNILLMVLPFLLAAVLLYMLYYGVKLKQIKRLKYTREFSVNGVFEDEELVLAEIIYNNSVLPVFFIDVESYIYNNLKLIERETRDNIYSDNLADIIAYEVAGVSSYDTEPKNKSGMQLIISRFHLMPFMQIKRHHKIKCVRRGFYTLSTARILTKNIAVEDVNYFDFNAELYVYPKTSEVNQLSYPVNFIQGDSMSLRKIMQDPFAISGVRDYASGDPFNMINFKATAKSGFQSVKSIKVNQLDYCSDRIFMIYINFQPSSDQASVPTNIYESLMEQALSFAASFISEALRKSYRVGLAANCQLASGERYIAFPIAGGMQNYEEILKRMAKAQINCGISFASLLDRGTKADIYNTEIFIITPYLDNSIDESISILKRRNNAVTIIKLENEEYNRFLKHTQEAV